MALPGISNANEFYSARYLDPAQALAEAAGAEQGITGEPRPEPPKAETVLRTAPAAAAERQPGDSRSSTLFLQTRHELPHLQGNQEVQGGTTSCREAEAGR